MKGEATEGAELQAALRECVRGYADLLTVAQALLAHVERQVPMSAESVALHHVEFDRVGTQLRQLQTLLDAFVVPAARGLH
jgi:hypothetical protein